MIAKYVEKLVVMSAATSSGELDGSSTIERAVADIAAGKAVVVVDDEDRENEGDLIFAAEQGHAGAGVVHGALHLRLHLRAADRGRTCDRLDLPPMHHTNQDRAAPRTP